MNLLSAALASALALSPVPAPVLAIQVTAASTCDYLQIAVFNATDETIRVVPTGAQDHALPLEIRPEHDDVITVPARDGLEVGFKIEEMRFGPWKYERPEGCDQYEAVPAAVAATTPPPKAQAPMVYREQPHPFWYYAFVVGLVLVLVAMIGVCVHHARAILAARKVRRVLAGDGAEAVPSGRHRAPSVPLRDEVTRRVKGRVKRHLSTRVTRVIVKRFVRSA